MSIIDTFRLDGKESSQTESKTGEKGAERAGKEGKGKSCTGEKSGKYKNLDRQRNHVAYKTENISPNYYHSCCACHFTNFCLLSR